MGRIGLLDGTHENASSAADPEEMLEVVAALKACLGGALRANLDALGEDASLGEVARSVVGASESLRASADHSASELSAQVCA